MVSGSGTASATITISPSRGFNQSASFSCSGLPANSSCSFSPATVTPSGSPVSTTLTISTGVQTAMLQNYGKRRIELASSARSGAPPQASKHGRTLIDGLLGGLFLSCLLGGGTRTSSTRSAKNMTRYAGSLLLLCGLVMFWTACGGNGGSSSGGGGNNSTMTPAGTYTVTITATSGSLQHSSNAVRSYSEGPIR